LRAQRGNPFNVIASAARQSNQRHCERSAAIQSASLRAQRGNPFSVTTMSAATRQSDGQGFRYNISIAELLELLAGRFINSAKAFARLRVIRVGNADKLLKL
jgi:hypothetical protein